ncbi:MULTISPECIES: hypothetical protein [unclassified Anabaena]|uniref:hypothetical protein n=1 Tax=unclassified Anabaena TaxID=2619674 RepID=UPI00082E4CA5|nr:MULTISPECIES: hypothetical protein [unclassified Anabaena]
MSDLEKLINQLPTIVYNLKLTIGTSQEIMQQVILINNAQEQLRQIQQAITQNFSLVASKSVAIKTLPAQHQMTGLMIPSILAVNPAITGNPNLIAEKFGNPATEISLFHLKSKINSWLEWGDLLQAIAADILGDADLVQQINFNIQHPSLLIQIQETVNHISSNKPLLKQQVNHLNEELSQVKKRLDYVVDTIKNSHNFLTIMLALSSFCGQSGFAIEWLDDAHELIISSKHQFSELTDILNDCEKLQQKIAELAAQIKESQKTKQQPKNQQSRVINYRTKSRKDNFAAAMVNKILVMACSLAVLGVGGWLIQDKFIHNQALSLNLNQESIAVSNFKSALKLGMEASSLVQKPPHPLTVWQQAASKWQQATTLLESVPEGTSVFAQAQERLIIYRLNYRTIEKRAAKEKQAVANLEKAKKLATEANFFMETSSNSLLAWQQSRDKLQKSINLLEAIPSSSFVYKQAQEILPDYRTNYTAINSIMKNRFHSVKR